MQRRLFFEIVERGECEVDMFGTGFRFVHRRASVCNSLTFVVCDQHVFQAFDGQWLLGVEVKQQVTIRANYNKFF